MELYVDNTPVGLDPTTGVAVSLAVAALTDPRKGRAGYTRTLRVPATPAAEAVFGWAGEIHAAERFNATNHVGRLEHEGATLIEGPMWLGRAVRGSHYEVHIIGASREWVTVASSRRLGATSVTFNGTLNAATIASGWNGSSPVKFFPVARQRQQLDYSSGGVIPALKVLSTDDYHPFIHVGTLLRRIFLQNGYVLVSEFADGPEFDSLWMSGAYPTKDVAVARANMDFLARRRSAGSAVANSQGRVYADPYQVAYTVGNLVDGEVGEDTYSNGGHFQMDDERIAFIPTTPTTLGFQYHLRYTTDYRMKSRTELTGFNEVYLGEQTPRKFTLANPYPDRRETFRPSRSYTLAVFAHVAGHQYQLRYNRTDPDGTHAMTGPTILRPFAPMEIGYALSVSDPELWHRTSSTGAWKRFTGDWALYDGFVGETGTMDVELTVRTAPENVSLGAPKFFNSIYFGGAEPGMGLTVSEKTWIRPVFYAQPTEGAVLTFADVCAHDCTQMELIDALRQMFNLYFQTDNRSRQVRMEPAPAFYRSERVVDWTDRVDLGRPIEVEELGSDLSREMVWCYAGGDGAVARLNRTNGGQMGRWSASVENMAAGAGTSTWENPLFTPSLGTTGAYQGAPGAIIVQAGDLAAETLERTEDLNFAPKIVRFEGLKALPAGQVWGWPTAGATTYPKIAFHAPESGYTLCFEDRDDCTGLHAYRDGDVKLWNSSRRIKAWLSLEPTDIESLSFPSDNPTGPDFRCLYRLTLDGEECLYRLEEVADYDPIARSTRCTFIKHIP